MKTRILFLYLPLIIALVLGIVSCDNDNNSIIEDVIEDVIDDEDVNEASTNPYERIVGSWKLIRIIRQTEEDVSSKNIVYTFYADSTYTVYNPSAEASTETDPEMSVKRVVFDDDWTYNSEEDQITGYLDLTPPSSSSYVLQFPWRFELKKKELMISLEPRNSVYVRAPTPEIHYYIRVPKPENLGS